MFICLPDNNTLVVFFSPHEVISIVSNGKYVRGQLPDFLPLVLFDVFCVVQLVDLIRIDGYKYRASVCLKEIQSQNINNNNKRWKLHIYNTFKI